MGDRPMYEFPLEEHRGDSDRMKSSLSDEIEASELINEELGGSMSFYYGKVRAWVLGAKN